MECVICGVETQKRLCVKHWSQVRRYRQKVAAVQLLGGKCVRCGYKESVSALEFHHLNPEEKEMNLSNLANKSWVVIKEELKKCIILCSNCHRIEHRDEKISDKFLDVVFDYKSGNNRSEEVAELLEQYNLRL